MSQTYAKHDLVWEEDGALVGYKAVVDASVELDAMPAEIRQHIVRSSGASFIQPRPALKLPLDLMWEDDGGLVGFKGVVNSRADPARLPDSLRRHVLSQSATAEMPHAYLSTKQLINPMYVKTSEAVGGGAVETTPAKLDKTQVWTGLSGKFTSTFPSTTSRNGSLNCSMNRHPVTKGPSFGTTPFFEPRAT